ncbi:helicase-exonuclease AddAB subunit AddA [Peptococcaceae bacterium]|nr:helicase-exonuclease AddAB subunit AddA [Peptococcaceae bacterium]
MPNWTKKQRDAIDTRGCNVLLSAAAGSGKTAVLVERILKRISEGINIDELLVVTFTNAAALEMRERLAAGLYNMLQTDFKNRDFVYKQLVLLNKAHITTLHSFCLEMIRENFYKLDLNPNFRVADDIEMQLLKNEVLDEIFEERYENAENDFINLVDAYGGERSDDLIKQVILRLYDLSQSTPSPDEWIKRVKLKYMDDKSFFKIIMKDANYKLQKALNSAQKALQILELEGLKKQADVLACEIDILNDLMSACKKWDALYQQINDVKFKRLAFGKNVEEHIKEQVKNLRDEYKKIVDNLKKAFIYTEDDVVRVLNKSRVHVVKICDLVLEFAKEFQIKKLEKNVLDFNDFEHLCLKLLQDEASSSHASNAFSNRFKEILVDEYQDINELQDAIISLLSKGNNVFMVGDIKQSIYRFRLAEPSLFIKKYSDFKENPKKGKAIVMSNNFRCRKKIVDGVNFLFERIMNFDDTKYSEEDKLIYSANYPKADESIKTLDEPIEMHFLEKSENSDEEDLTHIEIQARFVAKRIQQLMSEGYKVWDKDTKSYRDIKYRDMVLLLRSPSVIAETFAQAFKEAGIPAYAEVGSGYFEALEVQTILSLLKIIDNPRQDIPLVAVLRSAIFKFTEEELFKIRLCQIQGTYYDALLEALRKERDLSDKISDFLEKLDDWRTLLRTGDLANLIWTIYMDTGFLEYVSALPYGLQRYANLKALYDRARQYQRTGFRGLYMFLQFLQKIQENRQDLEPAKTLGENENVVRIMSIHKSKGLEFPVVILAGLERSFNFSDINQDVVVHKDLGIGIEYVDLDKRIKYPTPAKLAVAQQLKKELLEEEMRVLYVAMTRAKEKLILTCSVKNLDKNFKNWELGLDVLNAKSFVDWIAPAVIPCLDAMSGTWQVKIHNKLDEFLSEPEKSFSEEYLQKLKSLQPVDAVSSINREKLLKNIAWEYPFKTEAQKPAKVRLEDIKHVLLSDSKNTDEKQYSAVIYKKPKFIYEDTVLPVERGQAMHAVMRHIDFGKNITLEYIENLVQKLETKKLLTPLQAKAVNVEKILKFFESELGKRLVKAYKENKNNVLREVPFTLGLLAEEVYPDIKGSEKVIIQGIIDCVWLEEDKAIVLDYKNNYIPPLKIDEFIAKYKPQVNLYALAVERIFKREVKEKYLYSFELEREFGV